MIAPFQRGLRAKSGRCLPVINSGRHPFGQKTLVSMRSQPCIEAPKPLIWMAAKDAGTLPVGHKQVL